MFYTSDSYDGKKDALLKTETFYSHAVEQEGCKEISLREKNSVWSEELKDVEEVIFLARTLR